MELNEKALGQTAKLMARLMCEQFEIPDTEGYIERTWVHYIPDAKLIIETYHQALREQSLDELTVETERLGLYEHQALKEQDDDITD